MLSVLVHVNSLVLATICDNALVILYILVGTPT